jgi:hypothetical protein
LKGHLLRLARCTALLVRFIVGHLEAFMLLAALMLTGCFLSPQREVWLPFAPVMLWGLLMLAIYFPIDLQDRYLTAPFFLVVIPILAMLRRPAHSFAGEAATALALLLAFLAVADAASGIAARRRLLSVTGYPRGAYSTEIYPAARGLADIGLHPGETVACFGDNACFLDQYWARLAGTPIRAEVEVPDGSDPAEFWNAQPDKPRIIAALRQLGVAAVVARFAPSPRAPDGWQQLEGSSFYAYRIAGPLR